MGFLCNVYFIAAIADAHAKLFGYFLNCFFHCFEGQLVSADYLGTFGVRTKHFPELSELSLGNQIWLDVIRNSNLSLRNIIIFIIATNLILACHINLCDQKGKLLLDLGHWVWMGALLPVDNQINELLLVKANAFSFWQCNHTFDFNTLRCHKA